mgnify:CR=1 FL=1
MIKTLIFILLPFVAISQRYTVLDTSYTVNAGGVFFEVRDVTYSTGEQTTSKTLIGDTATYFNANLTRFQDEARRMATLAQQVFNMGKRLNDLKKENDKILTATGRDILDTITIRNLIGFTASGWVIRDTSNKSLAFSVNANGQFRYQIQGQATRNAFLFGDAITLNNYLGTGKDLFLFKTESGNYRNREGTILLRKPGGAQNREVWVDPNLDAESVEPIPPKKPAAKPKKKKG